MPVTLIQDDHCVCDWVCAKEAIHDRLPGAKVRLAEYELGIAPQWGGGKRL